MAAGRKSKYDTQVKPYLELIKTMRIDGYKEEQIHQQLDVGHSAWNEYKNKYPELKEALKISKDALVSKLEQTLYQKALEGNPTLLIFALKNLAPEKWADKKQIESNSLDEFFSHMKRFESEINGQ